MMRGFYNGISGVKTQSFGMDVWANNISNINTNGFKSSRPEYKNLFEQTLNTGSFSPINSQLGNGAGAFTTALDMSVGSFENSDRSFDFAIEGRGFFAVRDLEQGLFYTRAGSFSKDSDDMLTDTFGRRVQGIMNTLSPVTLSQQAKARLGQDITAAMSLSPRSEPLPLDGSVSDIYLPQYLYQPPRPTTFVDIKGNLETSKIYELKTSEVDKGQYSFSISDDKTSLSLSGQVLASPSTPSPKAGDEVAIKLSDKNGRQSETTTTIDANGNFSLDGYALDWLDPDSLELRVELVAPQEVPNVQKVSAAIIAANGDTNTLELKFTKVLPQLADSSTWEVQAKIVDKNGLELASNSASVVFDASGKIASTHTLSVGGISVNLAKQPNIPGPKPGDIVPAYTLEFDKQSGKIYKISQDGERSEVKLDENGRPILNEASQSSPLGLAYSGITSVANGDKGLSSRADGNHEGMLSRYESHDDGTIYAIFSNGDMLPIARLAQYQFTNEQGLMKVGGNIYAASANSGEPFVFRNANGEAIYGGKVVPRKLEISNVSLGVALTEVIATQKAYTASSKSITTSDEMIQTAIQMKK